MKRVSKFAILLAIVGMLAVSAGCSGNKAANEQQAGPATGSPKETEAAETAATLDKVDLTLLIAGDQPPEQESVLAELSKRTEKELNINLKVQYFPWADYQEKVKVMAAGGDTFDIYLDFAANLAPAVARKQNVPLNDLLDQYGQDIKKAIPQVEFDGLSIDGNIYGIPALYPRAELGNSLVIRKDLRVKYGIPEITSLPLLEQYLDAVKKNEQSMIPFAAARGLFSSAIAREIFNGQSWYAWGSIFIAPLTVDIYNPPYKVLNNFESDWFKQTMNWGRKAYQNGWFERDLLMQKDGQALFTAGKTAAVPADLFNIANLVPALAKNVPGAELEQVIFKKDMPLLNQGPTNNYSAISSTSKHPERAMMFLNWLLKSQENYDLYMLGIEGKHYTLKGDLVELPAGTDLANRPYNPTPWFIYNMKYQRALTTDPIEYTNALNYWKNAKTADNPLFTFQFNAEPVKTEMAQIEKVVEEIGVPVMAGVLGTDDDYQKLLDQLNKAGIQKVIAEAQKQVDAYLAQKK